MMERRYIASVLLAFLGAAVLMAIPGLAMAQAGGSVGAFSCAMGEASGNLYSSGGDCPTTLGVDNFFSFLVCNVERLSSDLMGHMYCGMVYDLTSPVWAAATLATVIFGMSFTIGLIPATGREAMLFLLKIAFVTTFATNADAIIGVGYALLVNGARDGIAIALTAAKDSAGNTLFTTGADMYGLLDGFLKQTFEFATNYYSGTKDDEMCKDAIFAVMATMMVAFPMISYLALLLVARVAITFYRAVFGYLYALVGITFLLTLSPFFVTFFLFKQTRSFFDKWLGYLVSFSLQMVMLFAFLAFIMSMDVKNLTENISNIIVHNAETKEGTSIRMPWTYCTLCDFKVVDKDDTSVEITDQKSEDFITKGKLVCKDSPPKPISILFGAAPTVGKAADGTAGQALIMLAGNGILSLIVLAFLVERLLAHLPYLAQKLSSAMGGAHYAPMLGGGFSPSKVPTMRMPGDGLIEDFERGFTRSGLSEREYKASKGSGSDYRGMTRSYKYDAGSGRMVEKDGITSAAERVKDGFAAMITGRTSDGRSLSLRDENGNVTHASGLKDRMAQFIANPNRVRD